MGRMRVLLAGALTALAVIASGCGSSPAGTANGATLAGDAAKLVPASAVAFASVDSDLGSTQWQRVGALAKTFTNGKSLVDIIDAKLRRRPSPGRTTSPPHSAPKSTSQCCRQSPSRMSWP